MKNTNLNEQGNLLLSLNQNINETDGLMKEIIIKGVIFKLEELNIKKCWIENCINLSNNELLSKLKTSPLYMVTKEQEAKEIINKFYSILNVIHSESDNRKNIWSTRKHMEYFKIPFANNHIYSQNEIYKLSKSMLATTHEVKDKVIISKKIGLSLNQLQIKLKNEVDFYNDETFMSKYVEYLYAIPYKNEVEKTLKKHNITQNFRISECKIEDTSSPTIPKYYFEVIWEYDTKNIKSEYDLLNKLCVELSIICKVMLDLSLL